MVGEEGYSESEGAGCFGAWYRQRRDNGTVGKDGLVRLVQRLGPPACEWDHDESKSRVKTMGGRKGAGDARPRRLFEGLTVPVLCSKIFGPMAGSLASAIQWM